MRDTYRPVCMSVRHDNRVRKAMKSSLQTGTYESGRYGRSVNRASEQWCVYQHRCLRRIDARCTGKDRGRNLVSLHCNRRDERVYERADEQRVLVKCSTS